MSQTKLGSFLEACSNTAIGLLIALAAQYVLFLAYDVKATVETQVWLTFWMTLVSIARSYVLRRIFNAIHLKRMNNETTVQ